MCSQDFYHGMVVLLNFHCLHIGILKQFYLKEIKGCGDYINPGRGRKCQLGKIPIEINSNMTVDLGCQSPKMKIDCQILNNDPNFTIFVFLSSIKCMFQIFHFSNIY